MYTYIKQKEPISLSTPLDSYPAIVHFPYHPNSNLANDRRKIAR